MHTLYFLSVVVLLIASLCSLIRAGIGPTWFDRILAVNSFTAITILLIAVYLFATGHPEYIDIALLFALINYVGTLAVVNYFNQQRNTSVKSNPL